METNVQAASVWGWAFNFILAERWVFAKLKKKPPKPTYCGRILRTPPKLTFCPTRYTQSLAEDTPCPTPTKAPLTPFPGRLGLCLASTRVSRGSLTSIFRCYVGCSVQSLDLPVEHCQPHSRHHTTQWFHTVTHQEPPVCTTSFSRTHRGCSFHHHSLRTSSVWRCTRGRRGAQEHLWCSYLKQFWLTLDAE